MKAKLIWNIVIAFIKAWLHSKTKEGRKEKLENKISELDKEFKKIQRDMGKLPVHSVQYHNKRKHKLQVGSELADLRSILCDKFGTK